MIVTLQEGRRAIPLDIRFDKDCPGMNLLTNEGFATALYHCSTMAPGSSATLAPVCSTFVAVFPSKIQYPKWNFFTETKFMCFVWGLFFPPSHHQPPKELRKHLSYTCESRRQTWLKGSLRRERAGLPNPNHMPALRESRDLVCSWTTPFFGNGIPSLLSVSLSVADNSSI